MKTGAPSVEWALETDLKQKQMVLGISRVCWMFLLYFPLTNLVSFFISSKVVWWQRGWLCGQPEWSKCPPVKCCCRISPSCYKHSMNPHVWACCQFIFWDPKSERHLWERKPEKEVCLQHMKTFEILLKIQALRQLVFWKQSILQLVV